MAACAPKGRVNHEETKGFKTSSLDCKFNINSLTNNIIRGGLENGLYEIVYSF
jgi:hypothetical protein